MEKLLADSTLPYQIVRPAWAGLGGWEDVDVSADIRWRHGVMFSPADAAGDDTTPGFSVRSYTVWTPMPLGLGWPCTI